MPVFELTQANSGKVMPYITQGSCVVLHHMNECIHCKMFMPVWKKVCKFYTDKGYVLISVESNDSSLLPSSMQNVLGFPTLRAYNKAKPVEEFNDVRTFDAVSNFVETYGKVEVAPPAPKKKAAPAKPKAPVPAAKPAKKKKKAEAK